MRRAWACVAALGVLVVACKKSEQRDELTAVPVHCVAPERRDVDETVKLRGRVAPPPGGDVAVASQVEGRVESVPVREGQTVAVGDVVALIDGAPSRDALRQADAALAQARANDANAAATLARVQALVSRGIAAKQELDDAQAHADAAHAEVSSAAAAASQARRTLGRVQVRTGVAGVVTRVWRGAGALVDGTASTPIVEVASSAAIEFVADATVRQLDRVAPGLMASVSLVSGEKLKGTVVTRASALDPTTGLGTVRVGLASAPPTIPVGTFGTVVVTLATRKGVPTLPVAALRGAVADGAEVAVCAGGKAQIRTVQVGWRDAERFEVTGVKDGELVAIDHVLGLTDGTPLAEAK